MTDPDEPMSPEEIQMMIKAAIGTLRALIVVLVHQHDGDTTRATRDFHAHPLVHPLKLAVDHALDTKVRSDGVAVADLIDLVQEDLTRRMAPDGPVA